MKVVPTYGLNQILWSKEQDLFQRLGQATVGQEAEIYKWFGDKNPEKIDYSSDAGFSQYYID